MANLHKWRNHQLGFVCQIIRVWLNYRPLFYIDCFNKPFDLYSLALLFHNLNKGNKSLL